MNDSLTATIFAEELMTFIFARNGIPWEHEEGISRFRQSVNIAPFDIGILEAVQCLITMKADEIDDCYRELLNEGVDNVQDYCRYAMTASTEYFPDGYSIETFLAFCAMVIGTCLRYYKFPPNYIPETGIYVVSNVLISHMLTQDFQIHGGWVKLAEASRMFLKAMHIEI